MVYIVDDIWNHIKTFLFHNIKTQGKHLKDDKNIVCYNNSVKIFNSLLKEVSNPKIIFQSVMKKSRNVKFIYEIKYKKIRLLIIVYKSMTINDTSRKLKEEYYSYIEN